MAMIYDLLLIIGLPFLTMALCKPYNDPSSYLVLILKKVIIIQPIRFEILEEEGCDYVAYSYVGLIVEFAPSVLPSFASAILARKSSFFPYDI